MLWAAICGGYFNFVTRVAYLCLGTYQGFTFDKSMIKKLYFTQTDDDAPPKNVEDGRILT